MGLGSTFAVLDTAPTTGRSDSGSMKPRRMGFVLTAFPTTIPIYAERISRSCCNRSACWHAMIEATSSPPKNLLYKCHITCLNCMEKLSIWTKMINKTTTNNIRCLQTWLPSGFNQEFKILEGHKAMSHRMDILVYFRSINRSLLCNCTWIEPYKLFHSDQHLWIKRCWSSKPRYI